MNKLNLTSSLPLCEQFALDEEHRNRRLKLLGLTEHDHTLAAELIDTVITPNINGIIDQFYDRILSDYSAKYIGDSDALARLKIIQKKYLLSLGRGFDKEHYFESRLRAGLAHAWIGLPLTIYQCGYAIQQQIILEYMEEQIPRDRFLVLAKCLLKIIALDMSLATETYHGVQIEAFKQSIDNMQDRQRLLQQQVSIDALTAVSTRNQILEHLKQNIQSAKRNNMELSVIMIDIDHFKRVNDQYGHQAGDHVLMQIAKRFKAAIRHVDLIGRYGGEEFLAILPSADKSTSQQVAERIRNSVASTPVKSNELLLNITVSEGVAVLEPNDNVQSLIERADKALYQAKRTGRNKVVHE